MRQISLLVLVLVVLMHVPAVAQPALPAAARTTAVATALEDEIVAELTAARTDPQAYARYVQEERARVRGDVLVAVDGRRWRLQEGTRAYDEAIAFLQAQRPVGPLTASAGLSRAARDHVNDQGPRGTTGHAGSDGGHVTERTRRYGSWQRLIGENISYGPDTARTIVVQLIVDDGVSDRGHRTNIFQPGFHVVGVACGPHKQYKLMCVIDFAGAFSP